MKKIGVLLFIFVMLGIGVLIGYMMNDAHNEGKDASKIELQEEIKDTSEIELQKEIKDASEIELQEEIKDTQKREQDKTHELEWYQSKIEEIAWPLGWIDILSDASSFATDYHVSIGENIFDKENARQLFTMEKIIEDNKLTDQFVTFDGDRSMPAEYPTDEMVPAYLPYEQFNEVYKLLFGMDFTRTEDYVFYDNRRAGANGVRVEEITITSLDYDKETGVYLASLQMSYSERAQEMLGKASEIAWLKFKLQDEQMVLVGFGKGDYQ